MAIDLGTYQPFVNHVRCVLSECNATDPKVEAMKSGWREAHVNERPLGGTQQPYTVAACCKEHMGKALHELIDVMCAEEAGS